MSENVVAVRSIEIVTAEITMIRDNARKVFLESVIQIGTRLEEAKQLVAQGEWTAYLTDKLGYKPSTAQNYMRIAREFGGGQVSLTGKTAADAFGQLSYSQILPLLGMAEEEREELAEGLQAQAEQVFANIEAVLAEAGLTMANVVKTTVFLTDLADFAAVNEIYAKHFTTPYPARSCVQVAGLPKDAKLECEVVAVR